MTACRGMQNVIITDAKSETVVAMQSTSFWRSTSFWVRVFAWEGVDYKWERASKLYAGGVR